MFSALLRTHFLKYKTPLILKHISAYMPPREGKKNAANYKMSSVVKHTVISDVDNVHHTLDEIKD